MITHEGGVTFDAKKCSTDQRETHSATIRLCCACSHIPVGEGDALPDAFLVANATPSKSAAQHAAVVFGSSASSSKSSTTELGNGE